MGTDTSDVTIIKDLLQRIGCVSFDNVVASTDYGSETARTRVYIVGIKADRRTATSQELLRQDLAEYENRSAIPYS